MVKVPKKVEDDGACEGDEEETRLDIGVDVLVDKRPDGKGEKW
jgi:hypothetical protein